MKAWHSLAKWVVQFSCACLLLTPWAWAQPADETVRLGLYVKVTRDLSRSDVQAAFDLWTREMTTHFKVPTQVRFYDDMRVLRSDFDKGLVNMVIASSMDFVRHFKMEELAEGFVGSIKIDHTLMLVASAQSGVLTLKQLMGKRVSVLKDDELSQVFLETLCLREFRRSCSAVFTSIEPIDNSNKLVMQLFFNKSDLILTQHSGLALAQELNPQIGKGLRTITQFPVKSSYFGFFSSAVNPAFRTRALKNIPNMHTDPRGRQVLEVFRLNRLELASPAYLLPFIGLKQDYEALRSDSANTKVNK